MELDLLEKIKTGDSKAFEAFFTGFYPSLHSFANRYLNDDDISNDILQEAFIHFWEKKNIFSSLIGAKVYLFKYVRSKCFNYLKKANRQIYLTENIQDNEIYYRDLIIEEETLQFIRKTLSKLTDREQEVIEFTMDGLKNHDIAEKLSLSINSVKTLKKRAYKKMRDFIGDKNLFLLYFNFRSSFLKVNGFL